jgi:hypothetical protein
MNEDPAVEIPSVMGINVLLFHEEDVVGEFEMRIEEDNDECKLWEIIDVENIKSVDLSDFFTAILVKAGFDAEAIR